jgi:tetratricopeptide (TPR) repeat protein
MRIESRDVHGIILGTVRGFDGDHILKAAAAALLAVTAVSEVHADAAKAAALRTRAFEQAYNLDYPAAVELFNQALAADPDSSATHRARASAAWLHIIFRRGSITVDQYLGGASRDDVKLEKPPAAEAEIYRRHATRALELAERRLAANPRDVSALYDVGVALGLQASYIATVEGRVGGAFGSARRAFNSHERVLELDPSRKDAGLIVGTYRYVVASLALPARWMAYIAGFGGDKEKGLLMVEEAARYPSEAQTDAKFALMLLYNREGRYADALGVIRQLMAQFPRNRILRLEAGATAIRGQQYSEGDRLLTAGIEGLPADPRPRAFGEEAMWFYKRGLARLSLRRLDQARADLDRALEHPMRDWVRGRVRLEQGKLADLEGRRDVAKAAYLDAARLATAGNDPGVRRQAEELLRTPYK